MTPQQILKDMYTDCSEYLEMMNTEEKFIIITNALAQKLAYEMAMKEHYKTCFEKAIFSTGRINS